MKTANTCLHCGELDCSVRKDCGDNEKAEVKKN